MIISHCYHILGNGTNVTHCILNNKYANGIEIAVAISLVSDNRTTSTKRQTTRRMFNTHSMLDTHKYNVITAVYTTRDFGVNLSACVALLLQYNDTYRGYVLLHNSRYDIIQFPIDNLETNTCLLLLHKNYSGYF